MADNPTIDQAEDLEAAVTAYRAYWDLRFNDNGHFTRRQFMEWVVLGQNVLQLVYAGKPFIFSFPLKVSYVLIPRYNSHSARHICSASD